MHSMLRLLLHVLVLAPVTSSFSLSGRYCSHEYSLSITILNKTMLRFDLAASLLTDKPIVCNEPYTMNSVGLIEVPYTKSGDCLHTALLKAGHSDVTIGSQYSSASDVITLTLMGLLKVPLVKNCDGPRGVYAGTAVHPVGYPFSVTIIVTFLECNNGTHGTSGAPTSAPTDDDGLPPAGYEPPDGVTLILTSVCVVLT